jgi:hypothetical protein
MQWIKINHSSELPKDGSVFLSLWKGRVCLTQYDSDEGRFYIMFEPADYSQSWQLAQDREYKFTHWMPLPDLLEDH